jgi:hypothetical protein
MFFDLSKITDPKTLSDQLYNELISKTSTWGGNGRPVVLASDVLSFAVTPDMAAAVSKAESLEKYEKAAPIIAELRAMLEENKVELVTFLQIIQPDDLRKHFEDAGPAAMRESFLLGVKANELQNVKPPGSKLLGAGGWIMWLLLMLAVVVIMYLLISSGALQNFLGGAKK